MSARTGSASTDDARADHAREGRSGTGAASGRPVFGVRFSPLDLPALAARIADEPVPPGEGVRAVVTANLDHVVRLAADPAFARAYARAWVATADGAPVALYARLRGAGVPGRVTGADLFADLMERLDPARHRPFLVAPREETARRLRERLAARGFAPGRAAFAVPAFGFERDEAASAALAARVREHGATHLFLGVGAPKSELWTDRHRAELGDLYVLSVGAALDFGAGLRARAPLLAQRAGLEWVWRVAQEPRRLGRRYFVDSWRFIAALARDLSGRWEPPR